MHILSFSLHSYLIFKMIMLLDVPHDILLSDPPSQKNKMTGDSFVSDAFRALMILISTNKNTVGHGY